MNLSKRGLGEDCFFGYSVRLSKLSEDDGGGWIAFVPELQGCLADGESPDEAYTNLKEVVSLWLQVAEEAGKKILPPNRIRRLNIVARSCCVCPGTCTASWRNKLSTRTSV